MKNTLSAMWTALNEVIDRKNDKSNFPPEFIICGNSISDKPIIAGTFNDYFSKINYKTNQNIPTADVNYSDFSSDQYSHSIFIDHVVPSDITNTAHKLKSKFSFGHYDISTKLLKQSINNKTHPITHIVNQSFITGIVPDQMKIAKVVPVYKSSERNSIKNIFLLVFSPHFQNYLKKLCMTKL